MAELIKARWIFPVDSDPIENGTIEIDEGTITAVLPKTLPEAEDLGNVAILPALINPHVHLEFSDLEKPLKPSSPFTDWVKSVIGFRNQPTRSIQEAIQSGMTESAKAGCSLLGEIMTNDSPESYLSENSKLSLVLFREIIGINPDQHDDCIRTVHDFLDQEIFRTEKNLSPGISPHAPYSVHWNLFCELAEIASQKNLPLAIHLAETESELELLSSQTGEFRNMLESFSLWSDSLFEKNRKPIDYLRQLESVQHALIIHGNYLDSEELEYLSRQDHLTLVYCPRTHSYFSHSEHPWQRVHSAGGRIALGTDGRSSNPDLNLWKEVQFLAQKSPGLPVNEMLKMVTINPAIAMGKENRLGSITPGKQARFFLIKLPDFDSSEIESLLYNEDNKCSADFSLSGP